MNLRDRVLSYLYEKKSGTLEEIASALNEEADYVEATLKVLEKEKIVRKTQKGLVFKKTSYELTPMGLEEAQKAYEKLQEKASQLQNIIEQGGEIPEEFMELIPLMLALSLIETTLIEDLMMFDSFNTF